MGADAIDSAAGTCRASVSIDGSCAASGKAFAPVASCAPRGALPSPFPANCDIGVAEETALPIFPATCEAPAPLLDTALFNIWLRTASCVASSVGDASAKAADVCAAASGATFANPAKPELDSAGMALAAVVVKPPRPLIVPKPSSVPAPAIVIADGNMVVAASGATSLINIASPTPPSAITAS